MIDRAFWAGKRVFITGHTGFKGGWLSQLLISLGAIVKGYALPPPSNPNLFQAVRLEERLEHVDGDILDSARLGAELRTFNADVVFHLAAQPLVRRSYEQPKLTYETNVIGTLNLYEAVRASPTVRVLISVTSDKCYQNNEWVWGYRELDRMGGYDPYSSSKACAELLTTAYRASFFNRADYGRTHRVSLSTARAGNVIGGGDWAQDRLVPDCIRALSDGTKIFIRNPRAVRPWQHVLEPLTGYLVLAKRMWDEPLEYGDGWNFGPSEGSIGEVEEVVHLVIDAWGEGEYTVTDTPSRHEARTLRLDTSKSRDRLHWTPVLSLNEAVRLTAVWYRCYYANTAEVRALTETQIESYMRTASS